VARYGAVLCPEPWKVPTIQDFVNLDRAMDGSGANRTGATAMLTSKYIGSWGGTYGGGALAGSLFYQGSFMYYWSQTGINAGSSYVLTLGSNGYLYPLGTNPNYYGFTLRCIQ
jgi:uncharacterized protein (TIGR02145 family)